MFEIGMHDLAADLLAATPSFGSGKGPLVKSEVFDWFRVIYNVTAVLAIFLAIFYVAYPQVLKLTSIRPLTLYGRCVGSFLVIGIGISFYFWKDSLVWGDQTSQLYRWAPGTVTMVLSILSFFVSTFIWRSPTRGSLS